MTDELDVAVAAARAAGEILRQGFGGRQMIRYKGTFDLVTAMDEEAERVVTRILRESFPDHGLYAEEGGSHTGAAGENARWIIDPLDGTTNYAHGFPFFAVSIALERAGEATIGVVYNPVLEEIFVASRGGGATLNGEPIHVSDTPELTRALLCSGFPYDRSVAPAAVDLWGRFTMLTQGMRRTGSAALDLCYVAAGRFDAYYERHVFPWDIAAGSLIVAEAGGTVTNYRGDGLDLDCGEIVASNGLLHATVVSVTGERHP